MNQKNRKFFKRASQRDRNHTRRICRKLDVSSRTISRWETGTNMPDISLLVNIAEIFNVSISEIINGERKSEIMEKEVKEVAEAMSNYAGAEKYSNIKESKIDKYYRANIFSYRISHGSN